MEFFNIFGNNDNKTNKHRKIVSLVMSKLNNIENIISKTPKNADISHKEFTLVNNVAKKS